MKVLVTGGCGFIGSHLVDALIRDKHSVFVIDNLSTGKIENLNKEATLIEMDILSDELGETFKKINPEVVYHHAAQIDVKKSDELPVFDAQVNVLGTVNVLKACTLSGVKKIIYASSAAVYGNPLELPIPEEHPKNPISFYGVSKYLPEQYIKTFAQKYDMDYSIFRYANVYGERQDPLGEGGVVSIFYDKLKVDEDVTVYGTGEQTRDFIYVHDLVKANMLALKEGHGQIMNLSTQTPISVNKLYETLKELGLGEKSKCHFAPARDCDIDHSYLNNKNAKEALGWTPDYDLTSGLKKMDQAYKGL